MEYNRQPSYQKKEYNKIGGWLIVVCITLILSFFYSLYFMFEVTHIFEQENWTFFTHLESEGYHPLFAGLIYFETFVNLVTLIFIPILLVIFFKKKRTFPMLFIIYAIVRLVIGIIDFVVAEAIFSSYPEDWFDSTADEDIQDLVSAIIYTFIWVPYMVKSVRVKETFVN